MSVNNLTPKVRSKAKKVLNLAVRSKRSMKLNELNFVRTSTFIGKEAKRISNPSIDKRKLKKLINTDFYAIGSASLGGGGGGGLLGLLGDILGFGGGGGRGRGGRGGRRGGPPSRRAQQRYRRRFGNRAGNRRFGRMPQFGRGGGVRIPRAGGVLGVAMAGLEYGGRVSEGQTQTQAITGTAASTAGGIAGAYAGAKGGALLGAGIGALFGGVGAVPGAAIGGFLGGIAGGFGGSMLAGGAADRLTGVVGKDKASEEADKELTEETKVNPLGLTLDKFDQVVDRFAKLIPKINIAKEDEIEFPEMLSFSGRKLPFTVHRQAREALEKYEKTGEKQVVQTEQGLIQVGPTAGNRLGIFGGPDLTPKLSFNPNLTPDSYEKTAQQLAAAQLFFNLPATLSPTGGLKKGSPRVVNPPAVRNPVTRPGVPQGPAVPPTTTVTPLTERLTPYLRPTPATPIKKTVPVKVPVRRLTGKDNTTAAETFAERGRVEDNMSGRTGAFEQRANQDRQNVKFAQDVLGRKPNERGELKTEVITSRDGSKTVVRRPGGDFVTGEEYMQRRIPKEYPEGVPEKSLQELNPAAKPTLQDKINQQILQQQEQLQNPKIQEYNRVNTFTRPVGDRSSANIKPGSQEIASADIGKSGGINYYTSYNAPNNTTIIMQQGGDQMPPQSSPPQMMASAPPPMITTGPSSYDVALKMHGIFQLNNLQTT